MKIIWFAIAVALSLSATAQNTSDSVAIFKVKGLNGFTVNQTISFGDYKSSPIKHGWNFSSSLEYTKFKTTPAEMLLQVFDINTDNSSMKSKNKFQYTLQNKNAAAEIYATEKFNEKQLAYKSNNPYIGAASKTLRYEYAFTAGILPLTEKYTKPWLLVLISRYDSRKDTALIFDKPFVENEGYATDGENNIAIQPVSSKYITNKKGKQVKVFGGEIFSGYNLYKADTLVAEINILNNTVSLLNYLDDDYKLILSSIASAMLLKNIKDVEKEF